MLEMECWISASGCKWVYLFAFTIRSRPVGQGNDGTRADRSSGPGGTNPSESTRWGATGRRATRPARMSARHSWDGSPKVVANPPTRRRTGVEESRRDSSAPGNGASTGPENGGENNL